MIQRLRVRVLSTIARLARRRQDWPAASSFFLRAAELSNGDHMLWSEAAKAARFARNGDEFEILERATECPNASSDTWYRYGRYLEEKGEFDGARNAYVMAEQAGGEAGHMSFRQARCLEATDDVTGACVKFRMAASEGFDPRKCFEELRRILRADPLWLRLELFREGQEYFGPEDGWTLQHAKLAGDMKSHVEAVELYDEVSRCARLSEGHSVHFALSLESVGDETGAREVLLNALDHRPAGDKALGVGLIYERARMWTRARREFLSVLEREPYKPALLYRVGLCYDREYKWDRAAYYFARAFHLEPNRAQWAYKCGHAFERAREYGAAIGWYQAALRVDPSVRHWWYRLGAVLASAGQLDSALDALTRSVEGRSATDAAEVPLTFQDHWEVDGVPAGDHNSNAWMKELLTDGPALRRDREPLLALVKHALSAGQNSYAELALRRTAGTGIGLPSKERLEIAAALKAVGQLPRAVEHLLDSRNVRLPDGVDLNKYLPKNQSRRSRLYAEFWENRPVDPRVILFESNHGSAIGCHPLAVFREMRERQEFGESTFVWAVTDEARIPSELSECARAAFVKVGSDEYLAYLATAAILVNNVSFPPYFTRREGQRYLNTWHGTPMKTLGRSMHQGLVEYENLERNFIQASHLLAPNELTRWALLDEHHLDGIYPGSVGMLGSPRLDKLVKQADTLRSELRERLAVAPSERLVLVAPTWRGGVSSHDFDEVALTEQLSALARIDGVKVFYRAHRLTEKLVRGADLPVEVVPADIDTNDLLAAVDHLVTDYSSVLFDYLVTGRPATLYVPDVEEYAETRGLYIRPEELPVGVAENLAELVDEITNERSLDKAEYQNALAAFCPFEDGNASARCVDFLLSDEGRGRELNGRPTVLFHGSLIPNGIASSLLAILDALVRADINVLILVEPKVLRTNTDREAVFRRLPDGVRLVSRVGDTLMTPEEFFVREMVESRKFNPGDEMIATYKKSWRKEALRITGDLPIDVAIEWDGYAPLWAGILSSIGSDSRSMIWQHNQMADEQERKYPGLPVVFDMYPWFDAVVSVSRLLADRNARHLESLGLDLQEGVAAVPNMLLFDEILAKSQAPMLEEHAGYFEGEGPVAITVGRLSMEKNHSALINAWARVLVEHPKAQLLIVGSGPLQASLEVDIARLGLGEEVHLVGQVSNPYPLMRKADVFILPSLHEGQPIVLFEAMSLGVPLAASACPGNVEAMNQGYGVQISTGADELGGELAALLHRVSQAAGHFDPAEYGSNAMKRFLYAAHVDDHEFTSD